jgi:leucine dehydrogenase
MTDLLQHEQITITRGPRSGLPIIIAVHSTALGDAAGGCRMRPYPDLYDGLADALALSEAMTLKCAAADLDFGGGKTVIALPPGTTLTGEQRRQVMLDFGDAVEALGGRYHAAEDVGTTAEDMRVARERTSWVHCLPERLGGSGEPSALTAVGAFTAIEATWQHLTGATSLAGLRATVIGLGQVGGRLAQQLASAGADLTVTDVDLDRRALAAELGARWVDPAASVTTETDVLVPAALGGLLSPDAVAGLRCAAVVGPANNQLTAEAVADDLAARGILWAPDFVVNAGGVIHGAIIDIAGGTAEEADTAARAIGPRLAGILRQADLTATTPYKVALDLARRRIAGAAPVGTPGALVS